LRRASSRSRPKKGVAGGSDVILVHFRVVEVKCTIMTFADLVHQVS
jgi:hypothetical protein